jgi:membrane-associated phospholipid phosphatase
MNTWLLTSDGMPMREQQAITRPSRPVIALILGSIAVALCYFFVDRPVAWFMHNHRFYSAEFLLWPPRVSEWLTYLAGLGIVGVVAWRLWHPGGQFQTLLLAIAANLVVTAGIKSVLKWSFGRTWPETWTGNNPALIPYGVYGFHPFHFGGAYQSFPSGHAAATFAVISILWLSLPRWRLLYMVVGVLVCVALVGLNFHFVGDVIAGAILGSVTGAYATRLFRLRPAMAEQDRAG